MEENTTNPQNADQSPEKKPEVTASTGEAETPKNTSDQTVTETVAEQPVSEKPVAEPQVVEPTTEPLSEQKNETEAPVQNVTSPEASTAEAATTVTDEKQSNPVSKVVDNLTKPAPNQPAVKSDEKLWGFISYLPLIGPVLALVMKSDSDFIKLHGRQGLLIFIFFFFDIFIYLFPYIGPILGIIVHFALLALALYSMYQALIGNWWKIPVFGDIAEMIPTDLFVKVTREAVMGPEKIEKNQATVDNVVQENSPTEQQPADDNGSQQAN